MTAFGWILGNKLLCLFAVATIGLGAATIYLGVDNANLRDEIETLEGQVTSTTTEPPTTEETTENPTTEPPENMDDYKLPTNIKPYLYDLSLYPNLQTGNFTGRMVVTVNVEAETETVKIHSNGLTINSVVVEGYETSHRLDTKHELIVIESNSPIGIGNQTITIDYEGVMKDKIVGLYYSTYTTSNGDVRAMATSKFEPTYARQAYPCFDEPNLKAKFKVHILKPKDPSYIALSNMPEEENGQEEQEDGILVHFKESVAMSTYLSCFIVSDFKSTEVDYINDKIPFRVYATPEQINKTEFAHSIGKSVIEYFITYFDIDFPLPKLDLAAIPDFVSGAMEHWGLVTFRETALLYSPEISNSANMQRVATVVAHELAHSWFGNLVTMNWWNDLWLNEGFAAYIEYKGVDYAREEWNMLDQFLIGDLHPILKLDATLGSHPIVQTVLTPDEITSIFDTVTYNKGAAVLRMLEDAVSEDNFKEGVRSYLKKHAFGNAVTQDLWNELEQYLNETSVTEFMRTWTEQMGYPLVTVKSDGDNYILKQQRYLTDQSAVDNTPTPFNYKWIIPITFITDDSSDSQLFWFLNNETEIAIPKPQNAKWVKFNYNQVGYYRVKYEDESDWDNLIENFDDLETSDRTHLIEETFRLAESGHIPYTIPLNLSKKIVDEREYVPWSAFAGVISELKMFLRSSEQFTNFKKYVTNLLIPAYNTYTNNGTWDEDPSEEFLAKRARVVIVSLACSMDYEPCLNRARDLFIDWIENPKHISQDLRSIIYNTGMANSPSSYWDSLWERFVAEQDAGEKMRLLAGLAYVNDPAYLTKLIELAKDEKYIRSQDYFTCLQLIADNPIGTSIVWDYVRENWEALVDRFGLNERYLGRMIPGITSTFSSEVKLEEMKAFFAKYPNAGAGASARVQALEKVENNIKWLKNNKATVEDWIVNNVQ